MPEYQDTEIGHILPEKILEPTEEAPTEDAENKDSEEK